MMDSSKCKYCKLHAAENELTVFNCTTCACYVHTGCTNSEKQPRLKGDNLFIFECRECCFEKRDMFTRMKLSWAQVIHVALYNLMITQSGRQGYFRWKEDICELINTNWTYLMPDREKTVTWMSTVAGTLSVHSKVFKSGYLVFNEAGWWSLRQVTAPKANLENYKVSAKPVNLESPTHISNKSVIELSSTYGRGKRIRKGRRKDVISSKISKLDNSSLMCHLDEDNENNRLTLKISSAQYLSGFEEQDEISSLSDNVTIKSEPLLLSSESNIEPKKKDVITPGILYSRNECTESKDSIQVQENTYLCDDTAKPEKLCNGFILSENTIFDRVPSKDLSDYANSLIESVNLSNEFKCENNLSEAGSKENEMTENDFQETEAENNEGLNKLVSLSIKDEAEVLNTINESLLALRADSSVRRFRRKLLLRKQKREIKHKLFNLQDMAEIFLRKAAPNNIEISKNETGEKVQLKMNCNANVEASMSYHHPALHNINILDRFMRFRSIGEKSIKNLSVHVRLVGDSEETISYRSIISPYTSRVLKPYIRRDFQALPRKLKLLREIKQKFQDDKKHCTWPIDYCYVQPSHIPAVNALCNDFFWPGIDMTECLQYPEFSCIVLYRKLIIGFAFMVPDVKYNEAYISFILVHPDWQQAGIGSNMIYHLIQTCMGKDITLHVSPTNPSMMLYQKFGFKAEKFITGFYEKYLPENSSSCNHALLLRLRR